MFVMISVCPLIGSKNHGFPNNFCNRSTIAAKHEKRNSSPQLERAKSILQLVEMQSEFIANCCKMRKI